MSDATSSEPTIEALKAEIETWKGHARKWEDRAKENTAAKTELDALTAASATNAEKAAKALDALNKRLDAADKLAADSAHAALRLRIATDHGVDAATADLLLTGADEATLTAQAAALGARSTGPKPNPAQGKGAEAPVSSKDAFIESLGSLMD